MLNTTILKFGKPRFTRGRPMYEPFQTMAETGEVTTVLKNACEYNKQCDATQYTLLYLMQNDQSSLKQLNPEMLIPTEWAREEMFDAIAKNSNDLTE